MLQWDKYGEAFWKKILFASFCPLALEQSRVNNNSSSISFYKRDVHRDATDHSWQHVVVTAIPWIKTVFRAEKRKIRVNCQTEKLRVLIAAEKVQQASCNVQIPHWGTLRWLYAGDTGGSALPGANALAPIWSAAVLRAAVVSRTQWHRGMSCYGLRFQHIKNLLNAGTADFCNSGFWKPRHSFCFIPCCS